MVIPVHDVNPVRGTPAVTYTLIAANVFVFVFMPGLAGSTAGDSQELIHHQLPDLVPTGAVDPRTGGCLVGAPGFDKSPALSVLTAMFLHGGRLHLLGNLLFLLVFGTNVEDRLGHVRFAPFYALLNSGSGDPLIGASGAIAGVLGAYLVLFPRARVWVLVPFLVFLPLRLPAWLVLGSCFVLQAVYSSGEGVSGAGTVAYAAHIVGFVAGMLLAWPLRPGAPPPPEPRGLLRGRRARHGW